MHNRYMYCFYPFKEKCIAFVHLCRDMTTLFRQIDQPFD